MSSKIGEILLFLILLDKWFSSILSKELLFLFNIEGSSEKLFYLLSLNIFSSFILGLFLFIEYVNCLLLLLLDKLV